MTTRVRKDEFIRRLAARMNADEATAAAWADAFTETLYDSLKVGESVTLPGFGSFYIREARTGMIFKFNPAQRLRALFGWSSTYKGQL